MKRVPTRAHYKHTHTSSRCSCVRFNTTFSSSIRSSTPSASLRRSIAFSGTVLQCDRKSEYDPHTAVCHPRQHPTHPSQILISLCPSDASPTTNTTNTVLYTGSPCFKSTFETDGARYYRNRVLHEFRNALRLHEHVAASGTVEQSFKADLAVAIDHTADEPACTGMFGRTRPHLPCVTDDYIGCDAQLLLHYGLFARQVCLCNCLAAVQ